MTPALIVLAKAPVAGRVKTRLCPPCTPEEAARLAEAALRDTLAAARAAATDAGGRCVCVLDGAPGPWLPPGVEVLAQRGDGLDERLAAAFDDVGGPALLIGMDTPQVRPRTLVAAGRALRAASAVLGLAPDGGYWAIGLREPQRALFAGVPMSTRATGAAQLARLVEHGLGVVPLPVLRDVDTIADAHAVAGACAPGAAFPAALRALAAGRPGAVAA